MPKTKARRPEATLGAPPVPTTPAAGTLWRRTRLKASIAKTPTYAPMPVGDTGALPAPPRGMLRADCTSSRRLL